MTPRAPALGLLLVFAAAAPLRGHEAPLPGHGLAPAPARLFEPPPAGSYELPVIHRVAEHELLDSTGRRVPLLALAGGQVAVVSFVYTSCAEGCPIAFGSLQRLDRELARQPALHERVRLVTVSFDPARDTVERMAEMRRHLAPRSDWRFLTSSSQADVLPVLDDYGQDVLRTGEDGRVTGHVLKVFLVDAGREVRNVYSTGFLDAEVLRNDAATVLGIPPSALMGPGAP